MTVSVAELDRIIALEDAAFKAKQEYERLARIEQNAINDLARSAGMKNYQVYHYIAERRKQR